MCNLISDLMYDEYQLTANDLISVFKDDIGIHLSFFTCTLICFYFVLKH